MKAPLPEREISSLRMYSVLLAGILAVAFAVLFIRWCDAPAYAIAAYRLVIAASLLVISRLRRPAGLLYGLTLRHLTVASLSGLFLALHFATWIRSLELTTVASSVVLVSTAPFWAAAGAYFLFKAPIRRLFIAGFFFALAGMAVISRQGNGAEAGSLSGNLMALLGAIGMAGYMLCGRYLRAEIDNYRYSTLAYSFAALFLLMFAQVTHTPLVGYSAETYFFLLLIALVPQLIGHSSFNWSLKYLSTPVVSTILLGEPVFATLLAFLLLGEHPAAAQLMGCGLILIGVVMAIWSEK